MQDQAHNAKGRPARNPEGMSESAPLERAPIARAHGGSEGSTVSGNIFIWLNDQRGVQNVAKIRVVQQSVASVAYLIKFRPKNLEF